MTYNVEMVSDEGDAQRTYSGPQTQRTNPDVANMKLDTSSSRAMPEGKEQLK